MIQIKFLKIINLNKDASKHNSIYHLFCRKQNITPFFRYVIFFSLDMFFIYLDSLEAISKHKVSLCAEFYKASFIIIVLM